MKAARETAGLTIPDVVFRTRIPRGVIEALENDDYASFSSPTYAKSFLTQYSEFVGVDSTPWLSYFEPAAFTGAGDVVMATESPHPVPHEPEPAKVVKRRGSLIPAMSFILMTGGLVYGGVYAYNYFSTEHAKEEQAKALEHAKGKQVQNGHTPAAESTPQVKPEPHQLLSRESPIAPPTASTEVDVSNAPRGKIVVE